MGLALDYPGLRVVPGRPFGLLLCLSASAVSADQELERQHRDHDQGDGNDEAEQGIVVSW